MNVSFNLSIPDIVVWLLGLSLIVWGIRIKLEEGGYMPDFYGGIVKFALILGGSCIIGMYYLGKVFG